MRPHTAAHVLGRAFAALLISGFGNPIVAQSTTDFNVAAVPVRAAVELSWNLVDEATYVVSRRQLAGDAWEEVAVMPAGANTYLDSHGLIPGKAYQYRVVATGGPTIATGLARIEAPFPLDLSVNAVGPTAVRLRWNEDAQAAEYIVSVRSESSSTWRRVGDLVRGQTTLVDDLAGGGPNELRPDEPYQYQIALLDSGGDPIRSEYASVRTSSLAAERLASDCYLDSIRDPERHDCSHAMVSAIRSIAGERPEDEWFSIQLKFSGSTSRSFTLIYADLDLDGAGPPENTAENPQPQEQADDGFTNLFNDATFSYNVWFDELSPRRGTFMGGALKVFDSTPYVGGWIGGLEKIQSRFFGSYVGFMPVLWAYNETGSNSWKHSYIEFSLRADQGPAFFRTFATRGGLLLPWSTGEKPVVRVVLMVPVGGVFPFR